MPIASPNPLRKTAPEERDEAQGDQDPVIAEPLRHQRILDDVCRGVGGGEGDRDHEVRRGEAEQGQHEELALPPRQEPFEHRDRTLTVRALRRHPAVNRQRAEEGEENEDHRREGREEPRRQRRDPRLIAEGGRSNRRR